MKNNQNSLPQIVFSMLTSYFRKNPLIPGLVMAFSIVGMISWANSDGNKPAITNDSSPYEAVSTVSSSIDVQKEDLIGYLKDRPFMDSFPNDPRKTYRIYVFGKDNTGAFITAKNFRQVIEVFQYEIRGNTLSIHFLNIDKKGKTSFKLETCKGPGSFDIKLSLSKDIKSDNKEGTYYSWKKIRKPRFTRHFSF